MSSSSPGDLPLHTERIAAIIVTTGDCTTLPAVVRAVATQTLTPDDVVLVHAGELTAIDSAARDALSASEAVTLQAPQAHDLGAAIRYALKALTHDDTRQNPDCLWVLHDDSVPKPDCLESLRATMIKSDAVAIAGTKQMDQTGTYLREVGVTTTRFGRRVTGIELNEIDQGQYDRRDDVFAVGTAGMLIRTSVWEELRGTDPALAPFYDGMDLCRRAHLAGHRVVVVPDAVVDHAQRSWWSGVRDVDGELKPLDTAAAVYQHRRAHVHMRLVWASPAAYPFVVIATVVSGFAQALWRLITGRPSLAKSELTAPWSALTRTAVGEARKNAERTAVQSRKSLTPLMASSWRTYLDRRDARLRTLAANKPPLVDPLTEAARSRTKKRRRLSLLFVSIALVLLTALILWPLVTLTRPAGGALSIQSGSLGDWWSAFSSWWNTASLGHAVAPDGTILALLPGVTLFGGASQAVITGVYLGSIVLAGIGMWFAAGTITRSITIRVWSVAVWVCAPALQIAIGAGRLSGLLVFMALPWAMWGIARGFGPVSADPGGKIRPYGSTAAAAAGGLALALASAGNPVLLLIAVLVCLVLIVLAPGKVKGHRRRFIAVLAPSVLLHLPVLVQAVTNPRVLFADSGIPTAHGTVPAWQYLVGWPEPAIAWKIPWDTTIGAYQLSQLLPLIAGGMVLLLAVLSVCGFARTSRRPVVITGWIIVVCGLVGAIASSMVRTAVGSGLDTSQTQWISQILTGWSGTGTAVIVLGTLMAAVAGVDGLQRRTAGKRRLPIRILVAIPVTLALVAPVLSGAMWIYQVRTSSTDLSVWSKSGTDQPLSSPGGAQVTQTSESLVPRVAVEAENSTDRIKVLVLEVDAQDTVRAQVLRGEAPEFYDTSIILDARKVEKLIHGKPTADSTDNAIDTVVAQIVSGVGDPSDDLKKLGIGAVYLPESGDEGGRLRLIATMGSLGGLQQVVQNDRGTMWWVAASDESRTDSTRAARAWIESSTGERITVVPSEQVGVHADIDPGEAGRRIVIAERPNSGWKAWLNGKELRSQSTGATQSFDLPTDGGTLDIEYTPSWRTPTIIIQMVGLLICVGVALTFRRKRALDTFVTEAEDEH